MALLEYKCPSCSGAIEWNSTEGKMKCPYCDSEFDMETLKQYDEELNSESTEDDMKWDTNAGSEWSDAEADGMSAYVCNSCGGQIVCDSTTTASSCPYCGNPIVMMGGLKGSLKPDFIIPFAFDKKAAKEALSKHLEGKKLLPKVFKDQNHLDDVTGIYVPFWIFDSDARASMRFKATKVRTYTQGKYDCTETSYYAVFRSGSLSFANVPVDGSQKMPDDLMDSVEPFDFTKSVDFQSAYLAGFMADKYDVSADDSIERANTRVKNTTEAAFKATASEYTTLTTEVNNIALSNGKTRYALLPVWILNTTWNGEKYVFAMNGQTGKFVGNLPCDKSLLKKYFISVMGIGTVVVTGLLWLINYLF